MSNDTNTGLTTAELTYVVLWPLIQTHSADIVRASHDMPMADAICHVLEEAIERSYNQACGAGMSDCADILVQLAWVWSTPQAVAPIVPMLYEHGILSRPAPHGWGCAETDCD